jgi:TolA-binding protein
MRGWLLSMVLGLALAGPAWGQDRVTYVDRGTKKEVSVSGTITAESPAGITVKTRDGVVKVPAADLVRVVYKVEGVNALTFGKPFSAENRAVNQPKLVARTKYLAEALKGYRDLEAQVRGAPNAQRYLQYKIANVLALQARDEPEKVPEAIKALTAFRATHPDSWQIVPAMKTLARLQEQTGKGDDARRTYEELAEVPGVPQEVKQESGMLVARMYLREGKPAEAEKRLAALEKGLSREDAQRPFVMAYLAASRIRQGNVKDVEAKLKEAITASPDGRLRALAYNLLGDYYRGRKKLDDAFWSYLRVDAQYNDDPEEQAKALYYLRTLFDKVKNDPARAKDCAARLRETRFTGTTYQKLAEAEKK